MHEEFEFTPHFKKTLRDGEAAGSFVRFKIRTLSKMDRGAFLTEMRHYDAGVDPLKVQDELWEVLIAKDRIEKVKKACETLGWNMQRM
jgi:hypothetical protein